MGKLNVTIFNVYKFYSIIYYHQVNIKKQIYDK